MNHERRVRVVALRRAGLEDRARGPEVEVTPDERDEVRPRLHVVDEAPDRAVIEPSSGQSFVRRAVQALAEVARSGRRAGRIVGVLVGARRVHVQERPGAGGRNRSPTEGLRNIADAKSVPAHEFPATQALLRRLPVGLRSSREILCARLHI